MKRNLTLLPFLLVLLFSLSLALPALGQKSSRNPPQKNRIWLSWGYHRAKFLPSDIHLFQPAYQRHWVYESLKAKDRSSFHQIPSIHVTEPQFQLRAGYRNPKGWGMEIGLCHLKYVVIPDQWATKSIYSDGNREQSELLLSSEVLRFEHTDGLNYLHLNLSKNHFLRKQLNDNSRIFMPFASAKLGAGIYIPRSDNLIQSPSGEIESNGNRYHLAGYGFNSTLGIGSFIYEHFFLELEGSAFCSILPDIIVPHGKAKQKIGGGWLGLNFGVRI